MHKSKTYGLSLPTQLFEEIDSQRGDISRSRYILRILEKGLDVTRKEKRSSSNQLMADNSNTETKSVSGRTSNNE